MIKRSRFLHFRLARCLFFAVGAALLSGCGTWQRLGDVKVDSPLEVESALKSDRQHPGLLDKPDADESLPAPGLSVSEATSLPKDNQKPDGEPLMAPVVPQDANVAGDDERYRIHPGDTLHIQVRGEDDLSGDFKVSSEGVIIYSLLGRISVVGLSASTVESNLTASLGKDYLVTPKLYVQVRSSVMRRVIVFGEVRAPGAYELPVGERFTLLQVIAKAGGLTDLANTDRVRIVRHNGAAEKVLKVSVTDLLNGRGESRDVDLQPNDVITIPQTIF